MNYLLFSSSNKKISYFLNLRNFQIMKSSLVAGVPLGFVEKTVLEKYKLSYLKFLNFDEEDKSSLKKSLENVIIFLQEKVLKIFNCSEFINVKMHQLDLLEKISQKMRNTIIQVRSEQKFSSLADIHQRTKYKVEENLSLQLYEELINNSNNFLRSFLKTDIK